MAELEHDLGVRSTYYVMVRSPYYNVFSTEGRQAIEHIDSLGHTIGLHVDLDCPRGGRSPMWGVIKACRRQRLMLAQAAPNTLITRAVSIHCPPRALVWREIPGFDSTYAPRWEHHYLADSAPLGQTQGEFSHGDPEDHLERPLQVALHPVHWFSTRTPPDRTYFWR